LGAHSDDIEIGCGGTLISLLAKYAHVGVYWVVFASTAEREREARLSAGRLLHSADSANINVRNFKDGFFPFVGSEIKEAFEQLKKEFSPDIIFTHYRNDLHQDHRLVSDLTWNTFRNHLILEYEIPKYDGDLASPNVFVPLDETVVQAKIDGILDCFKSQTNNHWFSPHVFESVLRLRGIECNARSGFAEGFYCRKMTMNFAASLNKDDYFKSLQTGG
jgi:LmbE family N-acetylglucosaminyl deacetylase